MPDNISLYIGIEQTEIEAFRHSWSQYSGYLPPLPDMIHDIEDCRAAIFNTWVRYKRIGHNLVIKPNRTFSHSIVKTISIKLQTHMPQIVLDYIRGNVEDDALIFTYSYILTRNLLLQIEQFMDENEHLKQYITPNYYLLSDEDLSEESGLNVLVKEIIYGFVHQQLTEEVIKRTYIRAIHETTIALTKIEDVLPN